MLVVSHTSEIELMALFSGLGLDVRQVPSVTELLTFSSLRHNI